MQSRSLSDIIVPFDAKRASFKHYITFVNTDGCKIHVPFAPTTFKRFFSRPEKLLMAELNRKMSIAFSEQEPEHGPLLLPESEFFLKVHAPRYLKHFTTRLKSNRERLTCRMTDQKRSASRASLPTTPTDLSDLESFSKALVQKRIDLNLSQGDVARSLRNLYGLQRSTSLVSRVERMDMSLTGFLKVYPIIRRWITDTENPSTLEEIMNATMEDSSEIPTPKVDDRLTTAFTKSRKRTMLSSKVTAVLEAAYEVHRYPPTDTVKELAQKLKLDRRTIRVWFANRRRR